VIRRIFNNGTLERNFTASTVLLVVVLIGTTMLVVRNRVDDTLRRNLEARGYSIARSIGAVATPSLLAYNYAALQVAAEGASGDPGVLYVVIHDKEGMVAGVAGRLHPPGVDQPLQSPLLQPLDVQVEAADGTGSGETALELRVPVFVESVDEPWGTVRVGLSYGPVAADLRRLTLGLVALGLLLGVVAAAAARWMARRMTEPLRKLIAGTEAVSSGDMSHRIPISGVRDLAELARAFNVMVERVQDKARESAEFQLALESLNATLEEQVRERTRALEESEAQYKTLVQHSPDSILIVQDGAVRFVNQAFSETFGVSERQVTGSGFDLDSIFETSSASLVRARLMAWERGEQPSPVQVIGRDGSGNDREFELRGSRIEYRGRSAAECLLIDITETKRLREQLAETEKLRALGELAGGVAHDFNNLLGAILGRVQLIRRRGWEPEIDHSLAVIEKAALDGRETVRRIQEFSRVRRDRQLTPVDLCDIVQDAVEITRVRWKTDAEARNVNIRLQLDSEPPQPVLGSPSELREVFTNLILNAVDAMPNGGRLSVRCRRRDGEVFAEIADSGVGMTSEIRRHLFDPFFSTKGHSGTGLGLSVVYGIVTRHGGTIDVDSSPGRGTTFRLTFPSSRIPLPAGDSAAPEPPRETHSARILVIDDEPSIAELLYEALAADGHAVETALNGTDGARMACLSAYDLVFTDLGMPDISGWEVASQIRQCKPDLPVVLVTGWGANLDEEEVRNRGIAAVVHKPFEIDELLETAGRLLGSALESD